LKIKIPKSFFTRTQTFQKIYIIPITNFCEVPNQTSKYTGVCWRKDFKKWQSRLLHKKKSYYGGYFDNEEHAAMSVNLLCDKYGKERKNPMIIIEPDKMQQVIYILKSEKGKENHFAFH
jgi:hypothetical protein